MEISKKLGVSFVLILVCLSILVKASPLNIEATCPDSVIAGNNFSIDIYVINDEGSFYKATNITFFPERPEIRLINYSTDGFTTSSIFSVGDMPAGDYNISVIADGSKKTIPIKVLENIPLVETNKSDSQIRTIWIIGTAFVMVIVVMILVIIGIIEKKRKA